MKQNFPLVTGWILFTILLIIFSFHVYWGAGGLWPGDSSESLSRIVIGQPDVDVPLGMETYLVSTVFLLFGVLAIVPFSRLKSIIPPGVVKTLLYFVAIIFFSRVLFGYTEEWFMPSAEGAPYILLNRILYSPLCLFLGLGYLYIARTVNRKQ